ncbi:hypothetical protein LUZ60_000663 [Juncus effusus]|nr:hypothetical protein LUZ60_000663 [Juncus effusus]
MALSLKSSFLSTAIVARPKLSTHGRVSFPSKGLKVECRKKGLHPTFIEDVKVYCDGEFVMTTSGTVKEFNVDTWSGNHPFFLGQSEYDDDEDFYADSMGDLFDDEEEEDDATKKPSS